MRTRELKKRPMAFSKCLLVQESILIWILTIAFVGLAYLCVLRGYTGSLPWLSVTLTGAWGAYGSSHAFYCNKSKAENTAGGIVYETAMNEREGRSI